MENVVVSYQAQIPIGNHVEIVWYEVVEAGMFGKKARSWPHEPLITDLTTGIEYASERWLEHAHSKQAHRPLEVSDELVAGARVLQRLKGVVRKCRVITIRGFSDFDVQTVFQIEPENHPTTLVNFRPT